MSVFSNRKNSKAPNTEYVPESAWKTHYMSFERNDQNYRHKENLATEISNIATKLA